MKNKQLKKLGKILFSLTLIFSSIGITNIHVADAKGSSTPRPSTKPSSKPTSSKPNAKPSSQTPSNKPTSNSSPKNSKGTFNKNYNSYNNKGYKKQYTDYLNNNYSSGFFSGSSITNTLLWYTLFNSTASRNHIHASDKQKELVDNVKDSKVPVYMLEIKTKDGETKYVTVTKEQYDEVKEGDNISLKDGNLEIKN
ncbi:hypothetical protein O3802_02660 [Gemella sp. 27098_8_92]|uniref:hypothetical protein n=1 Tax=Gemella sp. 27098_8_92 TaxID=3003687 RepID=UPI00352F0746